MIRIAEMTAKMIIIREIAGTKVIIEIIKIIEIKNTTDVIMIICIPTEIEIETVVVVMTNIPIQSQVIKTTTVNNLECRIISNISNLHFWTRIQVICCLWKMHYSHSKHLWTIIKVVKSKLQTISVCHHIQHNSNLIRASLSKTLLSLPLWNLWPALWGQVFLMLINSNSSSSKGPQFWMKAFRLKINCRKTSTCFLIC